MVSKRHLERWQEPWSCPTRRRRMRWVRRAGVGLALGALAIPTWGGNPASQTKRVSLAPACPGPAVVTLGGVAGDESWLPVPVTRVKPVTLRLSISTEEPAYHVQFARLDVLDRGQQDSLDDMRADTARYVRRVEIRDIPPSSRREITLKFDGRDERGRPLASGTYLAALYMESSLDKPPCEGIRMGVTPIAMLVLLLPR